MKIDLPTENWTGVFGFVPRSQLAENVPQIGDWQFAAKAQFYLHECGQITLGHMRIMKSTNGNGQAIVFRYRYWDDQTRWELPLPDVPMPKNIKQFKSITLCYFDDSVLRFLKEFQLKSLFKTVNLDFNGCNPNTLSPFMVKLVPLFTRIERICIDGDNADDVLAVLRKDYPDTVLKSARACIRGYNLGRSDNDDEWLHHWLNTPTSDGKPRVLLLELYYWYELGISSFIENIRKDFMASEKAPISYFIKLAPMYDGGIVPSLSLDNGQIKKERLVIHGAESDWQNVTILRYPIGANEQLIEEEMEAEVETTFFGSDYGNIVIRLINEPIG